MGSQYRDASNLNARVALHERFGENRQPWQRWVFDRLGPPSGDRVLELGCGPGHLWAENLDRLPEGWGVTLTDASPGMLREAERNLRADRRFGFRVFDAGEIPFENRSFDAVIANHMLYCVPDVDRAFSEIARVLGPGGFLYAATNGRDHMREMGPMLRVLDPTHPADGPARHPLSFGLENGAEQLSSWFSGVSLRRYEDALVVTEAEPLVDYALSTADARAAAGRLPAAEFRERVSRLTGSLEREIDSRGAIRITKDTGLFVARV